MKYKLLYRQNNQSYSLSDFIPALAASQFLPSIDGFIDIEELRVYSGEDCKVIMNNSFMNHPEMWPPADNIEPLFVSFFLNPITRDEMLRNESIMYFKEHEPIGCRDLATVYELKKRDIDGYYSSSLTLTLGQKYAETEHEDSVLFFAPYFYVPKRMSEKLKLVFGSLHRFETISRLSKKLQEDQQGGWASFVRACAFYKTYSQAFTDDVLLQAEYVSAKDYEDQIAGYTPEEMLNETEYLIKKFAIQKMVISSDLQVCLACLSLDTPVLFFENQNQHQSLLCKMGDVRELLHVCNVKGFNLSANFRLKKIDSKTVLKNKDNWKKHVLGLKGLCEFFIKD